MISFPFKSSQLVCTRYSFHNNIFKMTAASYMMFPIQDEITI